MKILKQNLYNINRLIVVAAVGCCWFFFFKNLLIALCQTENLKVLSNVKDEQILLAPWFLLC